MDPFVTRSVPRVAAALALVGVLAAAALLAPACGSSGATTPAVSTGPTGPDGGATPPPPPPPDAGPPDAGPPPLGTQGPWPVENRTFGAGDGIDATPVVALSTDETQNIWAATPQALYVMKPGTSAFVKFTATDGLHLASNPVLYHEIYCCPPSPGETQCTAAEINAWSQRAVPGAADARGISTIVGGGPNEVFVGYFGTGKVVGDCTDPAEARHSGKIDRVRLGADGKLTVDRFDLAAVQFGLNFWENRTVYRLVYDHVIHPHTLYAGADHGVDMFHPDSYQAPANPFEWPDTTNVLWMADHLHTAPCFPGPCPVAGEGDQRMGDWLGLAIAPDGDLWHAGRWAAGKIRWLPDLMSWEKRAGADAFAETFGNPYPGNPPIWSPTTCDYGAAPPCQQLEGLVVSIKAVAVQDDGTAWFGSGSLFGPGPNLGSSEPQSYFGIAAFRTAPRGFTFYSYSDVGLAESDLQDIVALPDGRIVFAGPSTGLVFFDPATKTHVAMRAGQGIPDDHVVQLELDRMVDPPALHVATRGGAAVIRIPPK